MILGDIGFTKGDGASFERFFALNQLCPAGRQKSVSAARQIPARDGAAGAASGGSDLCDGHFSA